VVEPDEPLEALVMSPGLRRGLLWVPAYKPEA
jgi:hypothetical protein